MLGFLLYLVLLGIVAGFVARALVPGRDPIGFGGTVLLGIVGSFVGGFLGDVLFRSDTEDVGLRPSGVIGSIIGAVVALLVYNAATRRNRSGVRV